MSISSRTGSVTRVIHVANAALALGLLIASIYVYPDLPDRIPLHFGVDGTPDRWGDRSLGSWLLLPLIGLGMHALMYGLSAFIVRKPKLVNMPDKKKLLELPPHLQKWVLGGIAQMMYLSALTLLVMFSVLQYAMWRTAHGIDAGNWVMGGVLFGLVAMPFETIGFLVVTQRRLEHAHRLWRTRGDAAPVPT